MRSRSAWPARRPGMVLDTGHGAVVVLPGPPSELQRLWPSALETEPVRRVLSACPSARPPRAALLRRERVGGREGARGRRRRRGRGGGDDLRPRVRDPRRPARRPGCRDAGRGARAGARRAARALRVRTRRTAGGGARTRPLPRAGLDARHGRVVHRRARRGPADVCAGIERRLQGRDRGVRERGEGGGARRARRRAREPRRRVCGDGGGDGRGRARPARRRRRRGA